VVYQETTERRQLATNRAWTMGRVTLAVEEVRDVTNPT
jgi:hypothetical protein